jgi:hypothetical protein
MPTQQHHQIPASRRRRPVRAPVRICRAGRPALDGDRVRYPYRYRTLHYHQHPLPAPAPLPGPRQTGENPADSSVASTQTPLLSLFFLQVAPLHCCLHCALLLQADMASNAKPSPAQTSHDPDSYGYCTAHDSLQYCGMYSVGEAGRHQIPGQDDTSLAHC